MRLKAFLAVTLSLAAVGCASSGLVGSGDTRSIAPGIAQQAAQQHEQVLAEFGGAESGRRAAYVSAVGGRIAAQSGVAPGGFRFTTLNSPVMNAFAVPGGYIYITRQMLGLMNSEAELASVLGHEAGHITADHSAERQNRSLWTQLGAALLGAVSGSGDLAQIAAQGAQIWTLSYSRSQELEADDLGVRTMSGAGYDPLQSPRMLASLGAWTDLETRFVGRDQDARAVPSWARTHPLSSERVGRATDRARATGRAGQGLVNRDQHLEALDGMIFDDDPAQGVIDGRDFRHPDLRLAFTVPQGFGIQNGGRAVSIAGTSGQAQFSTGAYDGNLDAYIGRVFQALAGQQGQVQVPQTRTTQVNGLRAATATARMQAQQGMLDVTVFAYEFARDRAFHFVTVTPAGQGLGPFSTMVQSLRRLTAQEAAAIRPRVIDIVTVGAGDSVDSLARRMAYDSYQVERFRILNGLAAGDSLQRGQRVKLVVWGSR
ncbi:M48 family metalloprotease [Sphingosinicella terrae]|uniref:M48 family metalloprotease n=1 Tax=Sphingosinicella terrae TaxID=2172047 RepID=UPI000E0D93E6|nr:M48 family metalloprotease [Sphingosinicella terrae]